MEQSSLRDFTLRLSQVPGLGPVTYSKLIDNYGTIQGLYSSYLSGDLDSKLGTKIDAVEIEGLTTSLASSEIQYSCLWERNYPKLLSQVTDAPIVLFYKGELDKINELDLISVVGSRKLTNEATKWTQDLVESFVDKGWGVVSGMATGIDGVVHQSVFIANGFTVAVLPGPLDNPLPASNYSIFEGILQSGGCVVSEYPPGIELNKGMFAARNRIVAGISRGTVVTLAGEGSGSLITASCAFDYGREVFSFPGSANQQAMKGCNQLIKSGKAKLIEGLGDVLVEFDQWAAEDNAKSKKPVLAKNLEIEPELREIYDCLANESLSPDDLVVKVDRNIADVISLLMRLQIKGLVKSLDNDKFVAVI